MGVEEVVQAVLEEEVEEDGGGVGLCDGQVEGRVGGGEECGEQLDQGQPGGGWLRERTLGWRSG